MNKQERWAAMPIEEKIEIMAGIFAENEGRPVEIVKREFMKDIEKTKQIAKQLEEELGKLDGAQVQARAEIVRKAGITRNALDFYIQSLFFGQALDPELSGNLFVSTELRNEIEEAQEQAIKKNEENGYFRIIDFTQNLTPIMDKVGVGSLDIYIWKIIFALLDQLSKASEITKQDLKQGKEWATLGVAKEVSTYKKEKELPIDKDFLIKYSAADGSGKKLCPATFPYIPIIGEIEDFMEAYYGEKLKATTKAAYSKAWNILTNSMAFFLMKKEDGSFGMHATRLFTEDIYFDLGKKSTKDGLIHKQATKMKKTITIKCAPELMAYSSSYLRMPPTFPIMLKSLKTPTDFYMWVYFMRDNIIRASNKSARLRPKLRTYTAKFEDLKAYILNYLPASYKENGRGKLIEKVIQQGVNFAIECGVLSSAKKVKEGWDITPNKNYYKAGIENAKK